MKKAFFVLKSDLLDLITRETFYLQNFILILLFYILIIFKDKYQFDTLSIRRLVLL